MKWVWFPVSTTNKTIATQLPALRENLCFLLKVNNEVPFPQWWSSFFLFWIVMSCFGLHKFPSITSMKKPGVSFLSLTSISSRGSWAFWCGCHCWIYLGHAPIYRFECSVPRERGVPTWSSPVLQNFLPPGVSFASFNCFSLDMVSGPFWSIWIHFILSWLSIKMLYSVK